MQDANPSKILLTEYKVPDYLVTRVDLDFDLRVGETEVTAILSVCPNPEGVAGGPLSLEGEELELLSVAIDDVQLETDAYQLNDEGLTILRPPQQAFTLKTRVKIFPEKNTALEGLYQSSGNYCTQCEAQGFRKITFYPDRPDVMAMFTTTIHADKARCPVMLSNGNPVAQGEHDDGRHWMMWEDPFAKPSYLFALVAGDLALTEGSFTTSSGRDVALRIYTEHHNADKTAHAIRSLQRSMTWDEEVYGLEYDLDIYMIVAVDDFNMGAMENKGLNVFNSKYVLALQETATDADFTAIEAVIAHEYFHNWTGNRVTCRDWFQLSLKEGLTVFRDQSFTADMTSAAVKRIDDVRGLRSIQFAEDAGPMAHPIRPDSYIEINNFYTVTVYEKGAEVVRMYQTLLGKDGFRKGMDLYFERHDGQAVTTDDFRNAMADANEVDLTLFQNWYEQAGTPDVKATASWNAAAGEYTLTLAQSCRATPERELKKPFLIPVKVGLLNRADGAELPLALKAPSDEIASGDSLILQLTSAEQSFTFTGLSAEPVPSLLRGFSAPVQLQFDYSIDDLAFLMANDSDDFNRWEAGQQLAVKVLLADIDKLASGDALTENAAVVSAFRQIVAQENADPALITEALALPGERYLAELVAVIEPDHIHAARENMANHLATALQAEWQAIYERCSVTETYSLENSSIARRGLRAAALNYWMRSGDAAARQAALAQFKSADNMSDMMAAMSPLMSVDSPERAQMLSEFETRWTDNALVMDKWFTLQATADLPQVLEQVQTLMAHPRFSMTNPNKVRALVGAFAAGNPVWFHALDGSGYRFLGERIKELNSTNPQVASRMTKILTNWERYDVARQEQMKAVLEDLRALPDLSRDVYEIVARSLDGQ